MNLMPLIFTHETPFLPNIFKRGLGGGGVGGTKKVGKYCHANDHC